MVSQVKISSKPCDHSQSDYLCGNHNIVHRNLYTEHHQTLFCVKEFRAEVGWVWLARLNDRRGSGSQMKWVLMRNNKICLSFKNHDFCIKYRLAAFGSDFSRFIRYLMAILVTQLASYDIMQFSDVKQTLSTHSVVSSTREAQNTKTTDLLCNLLVLFKFRSLLS